MTTAGDVDDTHSAVDAARPGRLTRAAVASATYLVPGALFVVAATANGAGYRYGVSDQAFYVPAVLRALDPAAFPRDAALIDAQGRLMLLDEVLAGVVRATGLSLEAVFLAGYLISLALVWTAVVLIGARVCRSPWAVAALGAAVTLRHQIPRTSTNSLEPYFHPRMLAFGLGTLAIAALLRRRAWLAVALVGAAALVHVTTAIWFGVLAGVALAFLDARLRRLAVAGAGVAAAVLVWAASAGPLRAALRTMDDTWRLAIAREDQLFPTGWPLWAWGINLGFVAVLWWAHRTRARRGEATREETAIAWGATGLVALFLATLPFTAHPVAMAVQFQVSRVFWLVGFVTTIYAIAAVHRRRAMIGLAAALVVLSGVRGAYIMAVERPDRALFAVHVPESPWQDAMRWLAAQPIDAHVLADPEHATKYGTSVRVSAARDVLLEDVKDSSIAIYARDVASRVVERRDAVGRFTGLTAGDALALADRYDLDYLVTEADLPLPAAYRNERFSIYALR